MMIMIIIIMCISVNLPDRYQMLDTCLTVNRQD